MPKYRAGSRQHRRRIPKSWLIALLLLAVIAIGSIIVLRRVYDKNLKPVSSRQTSTIVTIPTGASVNQIASTLKKDHLIRATWAFEWYVRSNNALDKLQAGTYALASSQSTQEIAGILTQGKITTKLVTILPGKRLDQVRAALINAGFTPTAVDQALQPSQYEGLPALVDKPKGVSLEGYLYPDSFQKAANTDPSALVGESLDEMSQHLTPGLRAAFAAEGLSTYQGIILASMLQQEVAKPADQAQAAQVFLKRLGIGMPLGSDVTAFYGAIAAGKAPSTTYDSPYNTLLHPGWPPTPISNVNDQALQAAAHPANTSWLYFVSGDDGTTYFELTADQHQADATAHCHTLCQ